MRAKIGRKTTTSGRLGRVGAAMAVLVAGIGALLSASSAGASAGQGVMDLTGGVTPQQMAQALVGSGVTISNVTYTGRNEAGGMFTGMGAVGMDSGVTLSSGSVAGGGNYTSNILGPNASNSTSANFAAPGDADLDPLVAPDTTRDAAVLEFDFTPAGSQVVFQYVFGSEEYNEYVGSFNDVFAFFVNGTNCATVGGQPVSVNSINLASNPALYRNNSRDPGPATIDTELDGLTTVLTCSAAVNAGATNHLKLAIADTRDARLDSTVFIKAGSLQVNTAPVANDDAYSTAVDTALTVTPPGVLGNDSDPEGSGLTAALVTGTTNGNLTLNPDGSFSYTPNPGFVGVDTFDYKANDGALDSNVAHVTITVTNGETPPPTQPTIPPTIPTSTSTTTTEPDETTTVPDETTTTESIPDESTTSTTEDLATTTATSPPSGTSGSQATPLARTGADTAAAVAVGLTLVALGAGAIVLSRRRLRSA